MYYISKILRIFRIYFCLNKGAYNESYNQMGIICSCLLNKLNAYAVYRS